MRIAILSALVLLAAQSHLVGEEPTEEPPTVAEPLKPLEVPVIGENSAAAGNQSAAEDRLAINWRLFGDGLPVSGKEGANDKTRIVKDRLTIDPFESSPDTRLDGTPLVDRGSLVDRRTSDFMYFCSFGLSAFSRKDYDRAISGFSEAIRLDPTQGIGYAARGMVWTEKHEFDKAIDDLDESIQLDSTNAVAYIWRGRAWRGKKQYDKAIDDLNAAIRIAPTSADAFSARGQTWTAMQEHDRALDDFDEAIRLAPTNADSYLWRAAEWTRNQQCDKALDDLSEAIRLAPNHADAYIFRARLHSAMKRPDKAMQDWNEAIRIDPIDASVYALRGSEWRRNHDDAKALADFEEAIYLDPHSPRAYNKAAWILATSPDDRLRDGRKAVELASRACDLPEEPTAGLYITLGAAYAECGDSETALICQDKAVELDPTPADVFRGLKGAILYKQGKPYREAQRVDAEP